MSQDPRELSLTRLIDAPPEAVYRAWTDPELLKQWFAPRPFTTPFAELDVRAGGRNAITMRSPEGQDMPNVGQFLEVVENRRIVFTDAYQGDWKPGEKPFMTVVLTFEPEDGKTRYNVSVRHWSEADKQQHEQMGFEAGWGQCADQLAELVGRG